jgi:sterol desaturase/sphingolipid hydroxylase (fatty acid hydroxylase superfamily)
MQQHRERLPGWLSGLVVGGTFAALVAAELRAPLRRGRHEPKLRRNIRNMAVAAISAAAIQLSDAPVTSPLSRHVERRRWGLLKQLRLPLILEIPLALLMLDYTLYLWHVAFHKVPLLWRFHKVHHADLDMDASTAIRFHFGEMVMSVILRTSQILVIGVSPLVLSIWNTWLLCSVMFHHSNVKLPARVERWLSRLIVTPRMHGIHHSVVPEEMNSNWSSGLTLWDWLHRTLRRDVPQDAITIGVAELREPKDVTLPRLLEMPFVAQPPTNQPDDSIRCTDPTAALAGPRYTRTSAASGPG